MHLFKNTMYKAACFAQIFVVGQSIPEHFHFTGIHKPSMKDIANCVVVRWASKWKEIARQLNIEEYLIRNIEKDYPSNCVQCCEIMLSDWLEQSRHPTWEMLINALDQVSENFAG